VTVADDVLLFKALRSQPQMFSHAQQVILSDVDEALGIAASGTAGLAGKSHQTLL
jgi:hypothetical protein